ncbi:MAG: aspartate-semialdehyde dehydrogenase [Clostridia bacterium]|nr:aspartate-semialdehyde dehydrogenase [Clostridia bacterium]
MNKKFNVAIVGATGLIGKKFIEVLQKRNFPVNKIKLFASEKSVGKTVYAFGKELTVEKLDEGCFLGLDIVFFSAGASVSLKYAPIAINDGALVVDNSSAFRNNPQIPLIIPEINGNLLKDSVSRLISNPNCSTAIGILPLKLLDQTFKVKRIIFTTFQAVSGYGQKGIDELNRVKKGAKPSVFPLNVNKNCIAKIGENDKYGYTDEELKMVNETQKIFNKPILISATCVRVPIKNCHGVSVEVEFEKEFFEEDIKGILNKTNGVKVCDLPSFETASGKDEVFVGRIKKSLAFKNGISFFCVGDNTLKGAALNAVQIAELLIKFGKIER